MAAITSVHIVLFRFARGGGVVTELLLLMVEQARQAAAEGGKEISLDWGEYR